MISPRPNSRRPGLSLMEVLVALTIFLMAFVALGRLVTLGSDQALEAQRHIRAADLCQSKLAEVIAGAVALESQTEVPFDEDLTWHWTLDCEKSTYAGLWSVTVLVSRQDAGRMRVFSKLSEMILDPQIHGNLQDTPPGTPTDSDSSSRDRSSRSGSTNGTVGGGN
jgi:general secretion pathway protein I